MEDFLNANVDDGFDFVDELLDEDEHELVDLKDDSELPDDFDAFEESTEVELVLEDDEDCFFIFFFDWFFLLRLIL